MTVDGRERTCGKTFGPDESEAAIEGHIQDCGCEPRTDGGEDTEESNEPMTMKDEIEAILPGREPLKNLDVTRIRFNEYAVLSARNGSVSRYQVSLSDPHCTCEDWQYNRREESDVCAHYVAAQLQSEGVNTKGIAMNDLAGALSEAYQAKDVIESAEESINEALTVARSAEGHAKQQATDAASEASEQNSDTGGESAAAAAAERLQEAFDEHLTDMQVQAHAGHVWFQTGQDTEDEWPYPGVDETFQAVTSPDCVEYVAEGGDGYDAHELYDEKPGEWWKNAIKPSDVEQYISEVLE